eukprot:Platyproteum_vivax@DN2299_c0_g1_i1.p1
MQTDEQIVARMCSSYRSTFTLGALMQAAPPEWTQDHMLSILQKLIERRILEMDLGPLMDRTSSTAKLLNQLASPHTDKYRLRFNFKHMLMKRVVGQMVLDEHRRSIVRSRMKTVYTMHRLSKLQTRVLSVITELKIMNAEPSATDAPSSRSLPPSSDELVSDGDAKSPHVSTVKISTDVRVREFNLSGEG